MDCENIREQLLDLVGVEPAGEQAQHLAACAPCAARLAELRQTMALLDEWHAPEPSPYFDQKLRARLRTDAEAPRGFFGWLRAPAFTRPAAAAAFVLVLAAGIGLYRYSDAGKASPVRPGGVTTARVTAPEGSAVADLQTLENNQDLLAEFDLLDEVGASDQTVQP